jgi:hypothetical protein
MLGRINRSIPDSAGIAGNIAAAPGLKMAKWRRYRWLCLLFVQP